MTAVEQAAIGRKHRGRGDHVEGYQVITIDGVRVGTVADVADDELLLRCGSWPRRTVRALPVEQAVVRDIDRTVLMLASPGELRLLSGNGSRTARG